MFPARPRSKKACLDWGMLRGYVSGHVSAYASKYVSGYVSWCWALDERAVVGVCIEMCIGGIQHVHFHGFLTPNQWKDPDRYNAKDNANHYIIRYIWGL